MKHKIVICMGSSCFARGNENNVRVIQNFLSQNALEADVEFLGSRCENGCSNGPHVAIDGVFYDKIDPETLLGLLNRKILEQEETK